MKGNLYFDKSIDTAEIQKETTDGTKATYMTLSDNYFKIGDKSKASIFNSKNRITYNDLDTTSADHPLGLGVYGLINLLTPLEPNTATSGTLYPWEYNYLSKYTDVGITLNNEIYTLQDNKLEDGYLVYTHVGLTNTNEYFTKCITITKATKEWVLTKQGTSIVTALPETPDENTIYFVTGE